MQTLGPGKSKVLSRTIVISTLSLFLLFILPLSALAQDTESIATLRQMGKAFAEIAERTSPAVVGVEVERTVAQDYITESPFGPMDPFEDDFFGFFFRRRSPRRLSLIHI